MCSLEDGDTIMDIKTSKIASTVCMKCRQCPGIVVIRINDSMCRDCFMKYTTHKFRASFGKSRLIRDGQTVLVAFSGGQGSVAMLHLICEGLSRRAQKKLRFNPTLVFINESSCLKKVDKNSIEIDVKTIESIMKSSNLEFQCFHLNQIYNNDLKNTSIPYDELENRLQNALSNCTNITSRLQLIDIMRENLLVAIAKSLDVEMLIMGDSMTRLAEHTLVSIATGRGASVGQSTAFADLTHNDVTIVRPLRSFPMKEIAVYNRLNSIDYVTMPTLVTKVSAHSSINKLTEKFVGQLSSNSATITSTICRTAEKLDVAADKFGKSCELCQRVFDIKEDLNTSSAHSANQISTLLSMPRPPSVADILASVDQSQSSDVLHNSLCYACRVFLRDLKSSENLPVYKKTIKSVKEIENELSEFIL